MRTAFPTKTETRKKLTYTLGTYEEYRKQWNTIPPNMQTRIQEIHLKRIRDLSGFVGLENSGPVISWDPSVTLDSEV